MAHDPVDELLNVLDDELAGHPSPSMLARVRGAITAQPPHYSWRRWAAPMGLAGVVLVAVTVWLPGAGSKPEDSMTAPVTTMASAPPVRAVIPAVPPVPVRVPSVHQTRVARTLASPHDEVIVSPDVRLGLEQLGRAMANGRVTAASLDAEPWTFEPVVITPTIIEPVTITIATGETDGGGSATVGDKNRLSSPPSRTGSVL